MHGFLLYVYQYAIGVHCSDYKVMLQLLISKEIGLQKMDHLLPDEFILLIFFPCLLRLKCVLFAKVKYICYKNTNTYEEKFICIIPNNPINHY